MGVCSGGQLDFLGGIGADCGGDAEGPPCCCCCCCGESKRRPRGTTTLGHSGPSKGERDTSSSGHGGDWSRNGSSKKRIILTMMRRWPPLRTGLLSLAKAGQVSAIGDSTVQITLRNSNTAIASIRTISHSWSCVGPFPGITQQMSFRRQVWICPNRTALFSSKLGILYRINLDKPISTLLESNHDRWFVAIL